MRRIFSLLLLLVFIFSLAGPSFSVKKKSVRKTKTKITRKVSKSKKGARPVFPVYKGPVKASPSPAPPVVPPMPPTKPVQKSKNKSAIFGEAGYGGGALVLGLGYKGSFTKEIGYSVGVGYGIGNQYGVVVLDFARATYNLKGYFLGGGLSYAMYSATIADIPGISGNISSKSLLGLELFGGTRFGDFICRAGYSTALGIRVSASYEF